MFRRAAILAAAACLAAPAAGAAALVQPGPTPAPPGSRATLWISDNRARTRPVRLRLTLRYAMQCGWPGSGPLVLVFPAAMQLPAHLPRKAVLVNGRSAAAVLTGRRLTIALPRRPVILCDVIAPGTLRLVLAPSARLGNPPRAGRYVLVTRLQRLELRTRFRIVAAGR